MQNAMLFWLFCLGGGTVFVGLGYSASTSSLSPFSLLGMTTTGMEFIGVLLYVLSCCLIQSLKVGNLSIGRRLFNGSYEIGKKEDDESWLINTKKKPLLQKK
jgi:hypothetical protein